MNQPILYGSNNSYEYRFYTCSIYIYDKNNASYMISQDYYYSPVPGYVNYYSDNSNYKDNCMIYFSMLGLYCDLYGHIFQYTSYRNILFLVTLFFKYKINKYMIHMLAL